MAGSKASGLDVYPEVGAGDKLAAIEAFTKISGPVMDVPTMRIISRIFLRYILPLPSSEPPYAKGVSKEDLFFVWGGVIFSGCIPEMIFMFGNTPGA